MKGPATVGPRVVNWKNEAELVIALNPIEGVHLATSSGDCAGCDYTYVKGDWVFRNNTGVLLGVSCCAPQYVAGLGGGGSSVVAEDGEGRDFVPLSQVMPHGKSRADMCPDCFQIPSTNGVCGC